MSKEWDPQNVFDVLGCEISRQILALASVRPLSADELAEYCDVSGPTIYRRINTLQEYDMLDEQIEVDDDGHHYKRFETTLEEARFRVGDGSYDIDIELRKDYTDRFADFWSDMEEGADPPGKDGRSPTREGSSSDVSGG